MPFYEESPESSGRYMGGTYGAKRRLEAMRIANAEAARQRAERAAELDQKRFDLESQGKELDSNRKRQEQDEADIMFRLKQGFSFNDNIDRLKTDLSNPMGPETFQETQFRKNPQTPSMIMDEQKQLADERARARFRKPEKPEKPDYSTENAINAVLAYTKTVNPQTGEPYDFDTAKAIVLRGNRNINPNDPRWESAKVSTMPKPEPEDNGPSLTDRIKGMIFPAARNVPEDMGDTSPKTSIPQLSTGDILGTSSEDEDQGEQSSMESEDQTPPSDENDILSDYPDAFPLKDGSYGIMKDGRIHRIIVQ